MRKEKMNVCVGIPRKQMVGEAKSGQMADNSLTQSINTVFLSFFVQDG
jgi:hypothetical protein